MHSSKFATDLEKIFKKFIVQKKIIFRLDGYTNALTFAAITIETIKQTETFVREQMYNYLKRTTAEAINANHDSFISDDDNVLVSKEQLIDHFGKVYATDPANFRFQPGEVILIKELVNWVKGKMGEQQNKGLKLFKSKRPKQPKQLSTKTSLSEPSEKKLKSELIQRVICCMQSYGADQFFDIELNYVIHDETVDVRIKKGVGVYGMVRCEICHAEDKNKNKPKRVFYNESSKWPTWVLSNFTKHLKTAHHLKRSESKNQKTKSACAMSPDKQVKSNDEEQEMLITFVVVVDAEEKVDEKKEKTDALDADPVINEQHNYSVPMYTQLAEQVNVMMNAALKNSESREDMGFIVNKTMHTLNVALCNQDGNCLFSSLAHQLFQDKMSSKEHKSKARQLRKRTVEYILDPKNFPKFMHDLKDRVYDTKKKDEIDNIETECKLWVKLCLGKDRIWGGTETIYAIAELEKVNVLIFNEHFEPHVLRNMNKYDRTVCLAYRLPRDEDGKVISSVRYHNDSVCDINSSTLYEVAKLMESREK